jgi:hypothetical protein
VGRIAFVLINDKRGAQRAHPDRAACAASTRIKELNGMQTTGTGRASAVLDRAPGAYT